MDGDERFKHVKTDPKFRRIPKGERKVKIDKRFRSMFEDEKFKVKYTVDKRGRPVNHTSNEDLKRYYDISSDESEDENIGKNEGKYVRAQQEDDELALICKNDKEIPNTIKKRLKDLSVDYARGEGVLMSDSSSDDDSESSEETQEVDEIDHGWGELDKDAETTEDSTKRLAICNMDWDRIRATDLFVLFNSFLPPGGLIHSIIIYPSEFGLKRMKEEEIKGPTELVENNVEAVLGEEETEEGSKYHMEKLRKYQLNRLKYYYAVMILDSTETASKIYSECDGLEYESSATKIDLRYIPDDTTFDGQEPKEICDKLPDLSKYEPRFFTTTALQQAKVELTWDETNPERIELTKKISEGKLDDMCDTDLQTYLASSSGSEDENQVDESNESDAESVANPIDKYRALLQDLEKTEQDKKNKDVEMEVTWGLNIKEKSEKLVKKKMEEAIEKTPFEQYLEKRREKKKSKREERRKKLNTDNSSSEHDDIPSDIDMNDPYFAEEFNNPEFKKSKKKKSKEKQNENDEETKQQNAELELLLLDDVEDDKRHFSLKKIEQENKKKRESNEKRGRKVKKFKTGTEVMNGQDDFQINVKDERFSAIFSSHHFNIDPTDPRYRKTKGMEALVTEKLQRRTENPNSKTSDTGNNGIKTNDTQLNILVKSVKNKTKALESKNK